MNLPKGYLEMSRDEYAALDVGTQRRIFGELRGIARYTMGNDTADVAIRAQKPFSPVEWIMAVKAVERRCERCRGSGTYFWGACINGVMSHSAPCARCNGKGWMDFDDMRRGRAYDKYAIAHAVR